MKVVENIYLKALEIGYNSGDEGISLKELNAKLKKLGYVFDNELFRSWYYRSFENSSRQNILSQPTIGVSNNLDDVKFSLSSDALFQYLEYVELKEARANSVSAKNYSILAILIALLSLLVSGVFSVISFSYQQESGKQTESQLKELIEIGSGNQKVLDSGFYELKKPRKLNESLEKKSRTESQKK